ncbi:uncharacterized protein LOC111788095 [Cucurbita pepo subsp. pepo]|uniref:uncharacterized protein LOC111788095 n=1 Tax=Cucurbita pepo subsp. pepo TaxID=3664 RepID=UPI000C9D54A3|nr:uncharacterized protein LOC111788095 [Cucurbita pepo subsp. pepo]XP_023524044.1 uncharacterized protein LOC111788095 [Cucurbita pepo subsp. pepo]XP_023524045.1 uncharacterized protein LOC111788095 [Cucurbita pepo subsp. pepo]
MAWGSIYRRRMRVFTLALVIYLDYKALEQREKWISKSKRSALWEKAHERNAKRSLSLIIELEGLWVKFGQYLSTRADVIPDAYIRLLKQLQDSLPPRPLQEVRQTIQKELGKPISDLFTNFVEAPLATASIAQVHRATLLDGREVVIKVQHEGVKAVILEDLKNAKAVVDWIGWAEPQYDFNPIIDEWCREAPKELDFNLEAENTRTVSRNLGCTNESDGNEVLGTVNVSIPEVIQSTEKVLILEYMDGIRLNDAADLEAYGIDKHKIVEEITRAYAHQIYVDGFFNGDPHPGNFLISKEPPHRPILLDFGLTKKLPCTMKLALAKMFLAAAEGDHVALLSSFAEMGLKLHLDVPEQAMAVTNVFFRAATAAKESHETFKAAAEQRSKNLKEIQEKMKLNHKEAKRFNPVDAFPSDIIIFARVLNLLRGLSSLMDVRTVYLDIMRPFAEYVLQASISKEPNVNDQWIWRTPIHSDVEDKLRQLLIKLGNENKILGIQVCAYKDGEVIIDTAAGVMGKYDPRPVQPDTLFPVFSVTKGITAGMLHWLVDNGKLKFEENIANIWPEFGSNGKDIIKVYQVLNHTSGLHNATVNVRENPSLICDWDECLNCMAKSVPETEPGQEQVYHYLSYGWLCGGIIEHATGKKFQEILEEALVNPLHIQGELYIGIPPGVESRLATLTPDLNDLQNISGIDPSELPSTFQPTMIAQLASTLAPLFNMLNTRRAVIPAANGHCSARALARYYAALAGGGVIPPPHSSASQPALGSHPHIPKFPSENSKKQKASRTKDIHANLNNDHQKNLNSTETDANGGLFRNTSNTGYTRLLDNSSSSNANDPSTRADSRHGTTAKKFVGKMFKDPRIHDAFLGIGKYENFAIPNGKFGLGFSRLRSDEGSFIGFGHSGMGGSTGFCNIDHNFAISVNLNKMSLGGVTASIVQFVCSELNIPLPAEFSPLVVATPLIN